MSVWRRDGRWTVHVRMRRPDGREVRVRQASPINTRRGAEAFEREVRQAVLDGTWGAAAPQAGPAPTLAVFAEEFLQSYVATHNKPSEVRAKRRILRLHLVPALGRLRLDQLGRREVDAYTAAKLERDGLARKTVNNHLTVLRKMLHVAQQWGVIQVVPEIQWLRTEAPTFDFLDFEEADRLIAAADPAWRPMITVALRTGLRQGELLGLQWDDVDLVAGRLVVRRSRVQGHEGTPKSNRSREVPLSQGAVEVLGAHRHLRGPYVFCRETGAPHTDGDCKWPLWRACRRAGIRRVGWHVLRHTFASHLVMRGVPIKAVQELLGHASMEMTMRYAHLSPDARRSAVEALEEPAPVHRQDTMGTHGGPAGTPSSVTGRK